MRSAEAGARGWGRSLALGPSPRRACSPATEGVGKAGGAAEPRWVRALRFPRTERLLCTARPVSCGMKAALEAAAWAERAAATQGVDERPQGTEQKVNSFWLRKYFILYVFNKK